MAQTFLEKKFIGTKDKLLQYDNNLQLQAVNAVIVGIQPQILIYCESGATVNCSKDGIVFTAIEDNGKWYFNLPSTGTWVCNASLDGRSGSVSINVTKIKQYVDTIVLS